MINRNRMTELIDPSNAKTVDHILIRDGETKKILINQRGDKKDVKHNKSSNESSNGSESQD